MQLVGVDRFLNEARAVTNLSGNGISSIAVAKWEGALDIEQMKRAFAAAAADHAHYLQMSLRSMAPARIRRQHARAHSK